MGEPWDAEPDLFKQYKNFYRGHHWDDLAKQVEDVEMAWSNIKPADPQLGKWKARLEDLIALGENARQRSNWLPPSANAPLSDLSGPPPTLPAERIRRDVAGLPRMPAENAAYLGRSLFSDFLLPVELGGSLLLVGHGRRHRHRIPPFVK